MQSEPLNEKTKAPRKFYNKWLFSLALVLASCIYIFGISDSNFRRHRQLDNQARMLQTEIAKVDNLIQNAYTYDEICDDPKLLEQYVRENLKMQRPNEEVFVIEYQ